MQLAGLIQMAAPSMKIVSLMLFGIIWQLIDSIRIDKFSSHLEITEKGILDGVMDDIVKLASNVSNLHRVHAFPGEDGRLRKLYFGTDDVCGASMLSKCPLNCDEPEDGPTWRPYIDELVEKLSANLREERGFGVELEFMSAPYYHRRNYVQVKRSDLNDCMDNKFRAAGIDQSNGSSELGYTQCESHLNCTMNQYCQFAEINGKQVQGCGLRRKCTPDQSIDGQCFLLPKHWTWERDGSIKGMSKSTSQRLEPGNCKNTYSNTERFLAFELVSPVIHGTGGIKSAAEALAALHFMGVEAGPTASLHMHVNAGGVDDHGSPVPGSYLDGVAIHNIWTHYARFQFVIFEMLQDSRIMNKYALPLIFDSHPIVAVSLKNKKIHAEVLSSDTVFGTATKQSLHVFGQLHRWVLSNDTSGSSHRRCETIFDGHECRVRYSEWRYAQLNLISLAKHNTLEFRAFPATSDPERAIQWVTFVLRFVEVFRHRADFAPKTNVLLDDLSKDDVEQSIKYSLEELKEAQLAATWTDLERELDMDLSYWKARDWLKRNPTCEPTE